MPEFIRCAPETGLARARKTQNVSMLEVFCLAVREQRRTFWRNNRNGVIVGRLVDAVLHRLHGTTREFCQKVLDEICVVVKRPAALRNERCSRAGQASFAHAVCVALALALRCSVKDAK